MHPGGRLHPILGYWRGWSAPKNVLIEARAKGSGQLVAKIAAVKGSQSRTQCRTHFPKHFAEGRHEVALVTHLHIPPQQSKVMPQMTWYYSALSAKHLVLLENHSTPVSIYAVELLV